MDKTVALNTCTSWSLRHLCHLKPFSDWELVTNKSTVGARLSDTSCDKTIAESREGVEREGGEKERQREIERERERKVYWCLSCKYASIHSIQSGLCSAEGTCLCVRRANVCVGACVRSCARACVCVWQKAATRVVAVGRRPVASQSSVNATCCVINEACVAVCLHNKAVAESPHVPNKTQQYTHDPAPNRCRTKPPGAPEKCTYPSSDSWRLDFCFWHINDRNLFCANWLFSPHSALSWFMCMPVHKNYLLY